jgi:hypothetical protein
VPLEASTGIRREEHDELGFAGRRQVLVPAVRPAQLVDELGDLRLARPCESRIATSSTPAARDRHGRIIGDTFVAWPTAQKQTKRPTRMPAGPALIPIGAALVVLGCGPMHSRRKRRRSASAAAGVRGGTSTSGTEEAPPQVNRDYADPPPRRSRHHHRHRRRNLRSRAASRPRP